MHMYRSEPPEHLPRKWWSCLAVLLRLPSPCEMMRSCTAHVQAQLAGPLP